ncbi:hypothetical protein [Micropruina glycogenica]|uniref:Uncharacterized protein n=1 Tax=Micropruina glycogenica TaxID=75385 RepID=A0A2N9JJP1_9ACTN|nr:hypothetical protein [Micropruina glycogenica]SPD87768.1 exported protein of unknown function [Micropruina glycogenica]
MSIHVRVAVAVSCLALTFSCVNASSAVADPTPTPTPRVDSAVIDEAEAIRQARASGTPVVATALTDEWTLVTADPSTGRLVADISASVVRVPDGKSGWRTPSTTLTRGVDGVLRPEAVAAQIAVSGGGTGPLLSVGDGSASVTFGWPTALPTPTVDGASATYAEVFPGVDLVVRADVEGAETYLVVKTAAAGKNPKVRAAEFSVAASSGLSMKQTADGGRVLLDGAGAERLIVPQARMWDSSGQSAGLVGADRVVEGAKARSRTVGLQTVPGKLIATADASFLDDPSTVYPVIIDPSASMTRSYVVRVSEDFRQVNDMSKDGKVGYNGWTYDPDYGYYKARMFYQFRWPLTTGGAQAVKAGSQITSAVFKYRQLHSPQYDCNDNDFGPSVRVKLYNTINADTTWPGPGSHVHSPVSDDFAVGSQSQGCPAQWQSWTITSMMKAERDNSSYNTRTTATIGIYSSDESDKNGWRHYDNDPGPSLTLEYLPAVADPTLTIPGSLAGPPWVSTASSLTLNAGVSLRSGISCGGASCLKGRVTVKGPGGAVLSGFPTAWVSTTASTLSLPTPVSGLKDGNAYTVIVEAEESLTGSTTSKSFSFWSDQTPGAAPTELAVALAGGTWLSSGSVDTGTPHLHATVALPTGPQDAQPICPETTQCLTASFTVVDVATSAVVWQATSGPVTPGSTVDIQIPEASKLVDNHSYRLDVSTKKSTNNLTSAVSSMTFDVKIRPGATTLAAPSASAMPITITMTNASSVAKYVWEATCFNGPTGSGETLTSTAQVTVPGCVTSVTIRVKAVSPSGLDGPWSANAVVTLI